MTTAESLQQQRLDKWLWAARFFKTRSLAKAAIEKGQITWDGQRPKASRNLSPGAILKITQGWDSKEVVVLGLAATRRPASEAQKLYAETPASLKLRTQKVAERSYGAHINPSPTRLDKKSRRQIHQFKRQEN